MKQSDYDRIKEWVDKQKAVFKTKLNNVEVELPTAIWVKDLLTYLKTLVEEGTESTRRLDEKCKWEHIAGDYDYWEIYCNEAHQCTTGEVKENFHKYCPYCGKEIDANIAQENK